MIFIDKNMPQRLKTGFVVQGHICKLVSGIIKGIKGFLKIEGIKSWLWKFNQGLL